MRWIKEIFVGMFLLLPMQIAYGNACYNVLDLASSLNERQFEEIEKAFDNLTDENKEAFAILLSQLPSVIPNGTLAKTFFPNRNVNEAIKVLRYLVNVDQKELINRFHRGPVSKEDETLFHIILYQQWISQTNSKVLKALSLLRPSTWFRDAYAIRKNQFGEHSSVEDFLTHFDDNTYGRIALLSKSLNNLDQVLGFLKSRVEFLTQLYQGTSKLRFMKRLQIRRQIEQTNVLRNLILDKQLEWEKDASEFVLLSSPVNSWIARMLQPGWAKRGITIVESMVVSMVLYSGITMLTDVPGRAFVEWWNGPLQILQAPEGIEKQPIMPIGKPTQKERDNVREYLSDESDVL